MHNLVKIILATYLGVAFSSLSYGINLTSDNPLMSSYHLEMGYKNLKSIDAPRNADSLNGFEFGVFKNYKLSKKFTAATGLGYQYNNTNSNKEVGVHLGNITERLYLSADTSDILIRPFAEIGFGYGQLALKDEKNRRLTSFNYGAGLEIVNQHGVGGHFKYGRQDLNFKNKDDYADMRSYSVALIYPF